MLFKNALRERVGTISTVCIALAFLMPSVGARCARQTTSALSAGCSLSKLFSPSPDFPTATSSVPMQTPVAELSILEDGTVKKVKLIQSSNQDAWDKAILKTLKTWRFSKAAPGCGLRKTKVSIDIHAQ